MITANSIGTGGLGRFANQMFTIAGCIGVAVKSNQPYGFPKWINHDAVKFFGSNEDPNIYQHLVKDLPEVPEGLTFRDYGYFWGYRDIHLPTGNWSIDAHMQSEKFFSHCMPLIRETFTFKDEPEQNEYVAIHYRAGDYQEGENVHHPRCSKEYYEKAMAEFPEGTSFLVFSDDIDSFAKMFPGQMLTIYQGDYIKSFKKMKRCKSFITANSSYSLMAAILGGHPDKKVVCPERWFGKAWGDAYKTMAIDLYPQGSVVL